MCVVNLEGVDPTCIAHDVDVVSPPSVSGDGAVVSFVSRRTGRWELYVMRADGTGQRQITVNAGNFYSHALDAAGSRIVWEEGADLYLANTDGTGRRRLTSDGFNGSPRFTPDGARVVFYRSPPLSGLPGLYVLDLESGHTRWLTPDTFNGAGVAGFFPDGETVLFASWATYGDDALYSVRLDGSGLTLEADLDDFDDAFWFRLAPDGRTLVYAGGYLYRRGLYVLDLPTGISRRITNADESFDDGAPHLDPDGTRIVFSRRTPYAADGDLYVVALDGSNLTRITDWPYHDTSPVWR